MADNTEDLKKLSTKELHEQIMNLRKQLVEQKRSRAARELANPYAIKKTRRQIARMLTLVNEQTKQAENQTAAAQSKVEEA